MKLKDPSLLKDKCLIDGKWVGADSGETFDVVNPSTSEVIAKVPNMGKAEATRAVEAAKKAQAAWRAMAAGERSKILRRWYDLMMENREDLGVILTSEQGKPLKEAMGEVSYGASYIEWFAEEAKRVYGDTIPSLSPDQRILVTKEPVGVCAAVTPWNFPNAMITRKAAPALAVGCTFISRPASKTPLSALAIGELAVRAGVPAGVFNVITGSSGPIGDVLTTNPLVRKFSFTGSTRVGKELMAKASGTMKKVSMELGGNAPFIVFNDADLEKAAKGAIDCKFRNAGQTCVCTNRIYVQSGVYDEFAKLFEKEVAKFKIGDGLKEGVDFGPLISEDAVEKVEGHIKDALDKGGKLAMGGKKMDGLFFEPTVILNATSDMKVAREETFGPLAPLFKFETEEEAIKLANDTEFGLASYFYTRDFGRIIRVSEALEYGMVGVNTGIISNAAAPFGGVKESGLGREGSKYGIDEYLEIKYTLLADINGGK